MYTRGLFADGSRIKSVGDDTKRIAIGIAYGLDEKMTPTPEAIANARLWAGADDLLEALNYLLEQTVDQDLAHGIELAEGEQDARNKALAAIEKATVAMQVAA